MGRLPVTHGLVAFGVAQVLAGAFASAQQSDAPVIRVDVRQVLVPVIVTDGKGHHVTGLKASDFHILEDDAAQEIAAFSTDTSPSPAAVAAPVARRAEPPPASAAAAPQPAGHTFVICVDALHSAFANSVRTREALTRLFEKEKPTGAQYVLLSIGRQLQVFETATSDPAAVLSRLHSPVVQPALGGGDAATLRSELNDLKNRMYDFCKGCDCTSARGCDVQAQSLKAGLDGQAEHWALLRGQFLAQLKDVVEELAKLPAGRTLILVSDGFSLQPAREFYAVAAAFLPKDERFKMAGPTDLESRLQAVIKVATERNVRIYSVDSRGLAQSSFAGNGSMDASTPADRAAQSVIRHVPSSNRGGTLLSDMDHQASAVEFQKGSGMEQLARATGGVYFHDSNDMLKQLRSALADGREYYVLAYIPTNRVQDGKFRKITVEVADKKLHVQAKAGYWAEPAQN
ncbi:MAG TPA: VWA domain-containing protein [Bryobacteraceae bacterium]|nr:VWA domain-containing protein [Bryobacteraceae bacterium]